MRTSPFWLAAFAVLLSCQDLPPESRDVANGWQSLGVPQELTREPPHPEGQTGQWKQQTKAREAAVAAHRSAPSQQSRWALAQAYFPEFVLPGAARQPLSVQAAGAALTIKTRGFTFRIEPRLGVPLQWGDELAPAGDGHFFAPVGRTAGATGAWKAARVEEYWVRDQAAGEQRAEYEVTLPAGVRHLHDAGEYLEFLDAAKVPVLRFHPSVVRDAQGRTRSGLMQLAGVEASGQGRYEATGPRVRVMTSVSLEGLSAPLVVDPGWSSTASMATARASHTATLLPTGKVLAVGGITSIYASSSTELYDPETDTWSSAGALASARSDHTATLLPSGKVLIAGGQGNASGALASAELYDPSTNTWTSAGSLSFARSSFTATLLPSGQVLAVGGSNSLSVLASAELYDPAANTWTSAANVTVARADHTATLLPSGKVLVAGGFGSGTSTHGLGSAEVYDPAANSWTSTGTLRAWRDRQTATLLPSGKVLLVGGCGWGTPSGCADEVYDPGSNQWTTTGSLAVMQSSHTSTLLPSGQVLSVGGQHFMVDSVDSFYGYDSGAELYDPGSDSSTMTGSLAIARAQQTATLLPSGKVLIAGGSNFGQSLSSTELYDPGSARWSSAGNMTTRRATRTATLLPSGQVLVTGGDTDTNSNLLGTTELYDPTTNAWTAAATMALGRMWDTATLLPSGKVLVVGGYHDAVSGRIATAELYDPATNTWTSAGSLATGRMDHTATLLPSGQVLVAGGTGYNGRLTSAELYDPATNSWTSAGDMATARYHHTATLLPSGQVLVVSGSFDGPTNVASAELYDPATNTWTNAGSLAIPRALHTATLLPSGRVLVVGGQDNNWNLIALAELYDPTTNTWTAAGSLAKARATQTATLLPSGQVLVAGGGFLASAELYDPKTDSWTTTASMAMGRNSPTATLLPSGQVLVAGGYDTSAELYNDTGATNAGRPVVSSPGPLWPGATVTLTGTGFRGVSGGSGGSTNDSPTDFPLVQLQAIEGGQLYTLPGSSFSATTVTVTLPPGIPLGSYLLSVTVNAITGGTVVQIQGEAPPVAQNATATTTVGMPVAITLTATSAAHAPLAYAVVTAPAHGTLAGTAPVLLYTPAAGFVGTDSFTFKANDGLLDSNVATVSLAVTPAAPSFTTPTCGSWVTPTVSFSGSASPGATVVILDGSTTVATLTADASGAFSGSITLGVGSHTLTATQTVNGQTSAPSAGVSVMVTDPTPPVISNTPGNQTLEATGPAGAVASWSTPTARDARGGSVPVTCAPASGSTFPLGTTTVTCTARGPAGNQSTSNFTVIVLDTTPPKLLLPETLTVEATDDTGATVTFAATADDLVSGSVAVTCMPASGSHFTDGATRVNCSAADAAGNNVSGAFPVIVTRTAVTAPTLVTPREGAKLTDGQVAFAWTASTAPTGVTVTYQLNVFQGNQRVALLATLKTALTLNAGQSLPPGDYTWQVQAVDGRDGRSVSSPTGTFGVVKPAPAPPAPPMKTPVHSGCGGCSSSGGAGNLGLFLLLGAVLLRRRGRAQA